MEHTWRWSMAEFRKNTDSWPRLSSHLPSAHVASIWWVVLNEREIVVGVSRGQEWYVKAMKPHFHWALVHSSSVGLDEMQLKLRDAGINGLSVYFLQVFTIWQEKANFMLCHRGRGQIKNDVCLSVCLAVLLDLTSQLSGLLPIPLSNLHESYRRKTGLQKEREEECKRWQWRELWRYIEKVWKANVDELMWTPNYKHQICLY